MDVKSEVIIYYKAQALISQKFKRTIQPNKATNGL